MSISLFPARLIAIGILLVTSGPRCFAGQVDRAAVIAHQDELQNLIVDCQETRKYDIDQTTSNRGALADGYRADLTRSETYSLRFSFLNGNARYDRVADPATLKYWASEKLPAIQSQSQVISATGRIEELTTQRLIGGQEMSFGGFRQLDQFPPDDAIDIALGLRLLAGRQWLTDDDLNSMQVIPQTDDDLFVLRSVDGGGHTHELRFSRRLLFALVYYRCSSSTGPSVEIINSDFHQYGNLFVPGKIVRTSNLPDVGGKVRHPLIFTFLVKDASANDLNNTADRYVITFPPQLHLFDARTNDQVDVGPVARTFTDDEIRHQLVERKVHELMFDALAKHRIAQALESQPTTKP